MSIYEPDFLVHGVPPGPGDNDYILEDPSQRVLGIVLGSIFGIFLVVISIVLVLSTRLKRSYDKKHAASLADMDMIKRRITIGSPIAEKPFTALRGTPNAPPSTKSTVFVDRERAEEPRSEFFF